MENPNGPQDGGPISPAHSTNALTGTDIGQRAAWQPSPDLQEDYGPALVEGMQQQFSGVFTPLPEVPVIVDDSNSHTKESGSTMKRLADYRVEESSNRRRRAFEVPLTIREATPAARSQPIPVAPAAQVNPRRGIYNALYDPMYELMGLPVDPILRRFLELEQENKGKKWWVSTFPSGKS